MRKHQLYCTHNEKDSGFILLISGLFSFTARDKGAEDSEAGTEGTETETPADHGMDAGHGTEGGHHGVEGGHHGMKCAMMGEEGHVCSESCKMVPAAGAMKEGMDTEGN